MELELVPAGDDVKGVAVRLAVEAACGDDETAAQRGRWWRAGVEEAIGAWEGPSAPAGGEAAATPRYAAPSPRRTRGATRA